MVRDNRSEELPCSASSQTVKGRNLSAAASAEIRKSNQPDAFDWLSGCYSVHDFHLTVVDFLFRAHYQPKNLLSQD